MQRSLHTRGHTCNLKKLKHAHEIAKTVTCRYARGHHAADRRILHKEKG